MIEKGPGLPITVLFINYRAVCKCLSGTGNREGEDERVHALPGYADMMTAVSRWIDRNILELARDFQLSYPRSWSTWLPVFWAHRHRRHFF